jgi:cell division protein FtsL
MASPISVPNQATTEEKQRREFGRIEKILRYLIPALAAVYLAIGVAILAARYS